MISNLNKLQSYSSFIWITVAALVILVSGCVSTGGERKQVRGTGNQDCAPINKANAQDQQNNRQNSGCGSDGFIEITENFGIDPEIRKEFNDAVVLLNNEEYADAIKLLKAVSGKTSKFSAPHINLGIAYVRIDELEKAEKSFKKAVEINNKHPVAHNELGLVYRKTGRYVEARQLYESLLAMYPAFLPARKNLGVLCDIYIQDLDCALEQYEEYLSKKPDDKKVKIWVADIKSRM